MESVAHIFRNALDAVDLRNPFGHLAVHPAVVDFLEGLALGEFVSDLADEHHHRRGILESGVHADCAVRGSRAARHEKHARLAGELAVRFGHVGGAALLAANHEFQLVAHVVQAVEQRQVAFARYAERHVHALRDERVGEDLPAVARLEIGFHAGGLFDQRCDRRCTDTRVDYSIRRMEDINELRRILRDNRVIAVVGLSADWYRPSYFAAKYMLEHSYRFIPVNPKYAEILGQKCYKSLRDIGEKVDLVDVF